MSTTKRNAIATFGALLIMAGTARAQGATGTTTVSVIIGAEASLSINAATALSAAGSTFANAFTGATTFTYKIRTKQVGGTGSITLQVTSDFAGAGGPSVLTPPTSGDALTYSCTLAAPGTACTGPITSSTTAATSVGTFGTNAKSTFAGNLGTINWTLTNDPVYATGTYNATVTFTISAA
jgi:hypothetical protein